MMRIMIPICIVFLAPAASLAASNGFEIQSSNVDTLKPGDKLSQGTKLTLPKGAKITFIDRTGDGAGVVRECVGEYNGPIDQCRSKGNGRSPVVSGGDRGVER